MANVVTQWNPFIITNKGLELRQRSIATGATITFNYAKIGQGVPSNPATIPSMTDIISAAEQVPVVRSESDGVTHLPQSVRKRPYCMGIHMLRRATTAYPQEAQVTMFGR